MNDLKKKYFAGIYGFVPNKPKPQEPIVGKISDSRLVKRSK